MTVLDTLAASARERVEEAKKAHPAEELRKAAFALPKGGFEFENALKTDDIAFICECKKASPSKGVIAEDYRYLETAKEYEEAGADCISVLTEPTRFLGSAKHLYDIAHAVSVPCLRKDFTVDEYMIYGAKVLGASAVLLICALLPPAELEGYLRLCDDLGLSALTEAHSADEIKTALSCGTRVIGVNNRNLKDFSVDTENSLRLREAVPEGVLFVSESGIKSAGDVQKLRHFGVDAVLVGETLMRAPDKSAKLKELRGRA